MNAIEKRLAVLGTLSGNHIAYAVSGKTVYAATRAAISFIGANKLDYKFSGFVVDLGGIPE